MPTTSERPSRDIRFSEKSIKYIMVNVAINAAGTASITITALRMLCRKSSITRATSTTASSRSKITWSAASSVNSEVSDGMLKLSPAVA